MLKGPVAPVPEPDPEPDPDPDPDPEPEPVPVPVPAGCFRPLHADRVKDIAIKTKSDFWLGFMVFLISSLFAYLRPQGLQQTHFALKGTWFGRIA
jgi:hypothetical protein